MRDLADAQVAAGQDVGIVCDSSTGGEFEASLFAAIESRLPLGVSRTPMQRHIGIGDVAAAWRSYQIIKELKPDVLHGHGAKGGVYARLFGSLFRASRSRVARVYTPHGGSLHYDENTTTGRFFFSLESLMGRFTDQLLFVSDYERRTYERKIGKPHCSSALVYNGLHPGEFVPVATAPDAADFLYIGMMRNLKGPDIFIDALAKVATRLGRTISAHMVGDGDDLPAYRERVKKHGSLVDVHFLPAMPAREAFALGRIMVVPSRAEAMPYIVLEALAAGRPMIASAVGGIPEIFGPNSPALVMPLVDSVASKMAVALGDEAAFAASMPSPGDVRTRFGADVMARTIEQYYLAALD